MTGRHTADAAHPVASVWAKPRLAGPVKHSTGVHDHHFQVVATFTGLRSSILQCRCGETRTEFAREGVE